jgi:hypothetical protein
MSHNRPDWLGDDGEFIEPVSPTALSTFAQKSKSKQHPEADAAAYKSFIILLVSVLCLFIIFGLSSQSTSADKKDRQTTSQCNMTSQQLQHNIQYARTSQEFNNIVGYYYSHCRSR